MVCGLSSVSVTPRTRAGVESVTQIRVAAKPGRAGSRRTSGDDASDSIHGLTGLVLAGDDSSDRSDHSALRSQASKSAPIIT